MRILLSLTFFLLLPVFAFADGGAGAFGDAIDWEKKTLPQPPGGWNKAVGTIWKGRLILVGGSGSDGIRWIDLQSDDSAWRELEGEAVDITNPGLLVAPDGIVIAGGKKEGEWSDEVGLWKGEELSSAGSRLPFAVVNPVGHGSYLAGFDANADLYIWAKQPDSHSFLPIARASLPKAFRPGRIALVRQQDGDGHKLWVVAERWIAKVDPGTAAVDFMATKENVKPFAVPVGAGHLLLPTVESGYSFFHTVTGTWVEGAKADGGSTLRVFDRSGDNLFAIHSTENETIVQQGVEVRPSPRLSTIDFAVLIGYFIVLLVIGNWFRIRENDTRDYFLGGNRIPGWAAGISIVLTNISAVSLLSIPAKAYATNWTFFLMLLTPLIAAPLVIKFVLPFFFHLRLTTAFEYLEKRFNVWLRCLGSIQYGLYEICRMGVLILLPSIVLSVVTGIDISVCILVIGVISTLYTLFGGLEAVVWTDVMQGVIMIGGILLAIGLMFFRIDDGVGQLSAIAWPQDKLKMLDWSPDIASVTVWTFLLALPIVLNGYVAHQPTVQRFMSARDIKDAGRALWTTGISAPLILGTLFLCGTMLFLFYGEFPEKLNPTMEQPDQLLAWFIIRELPVGMIGLLIAAIFAATMSSLDSGLNSLSSVFVTDFYRRFSSGATDKKALFVAKISTAVVGALGTGFGLWLATMNVLSLFDAFIEFASLLTGGLAGCFLLGIFTRRANGTGALAGWTVSTVLVYLAKTEGNFQFYLYATIGTVSCFVVGYLVSLATRPGNNDLTNLTLWTRTAQEPQSDHEQEEVTRR